MDSFTRNLGKNVDRSSPPPMISVEVLNLCRYVAVFQAAIHDFIRC
jgi:hypothetical protein